jgi:protein-S-isoprenylcysteine O-methyltransferase Ste14
MGMPVIRIAPATRDAPDGRWGDPERPLVNAERWRAAGATHKKHSRPFRPMNDDQTFRIVLMAFILVVLPIGIYHRVKSQATGEKLDRRQEGPFILATLRPVGAVCWLGLIAWMIDPDWMAWSGMRLPAWLRWTGVGLVTNAGVLLVWTVRSLGKNLTDTVVTRHHHTLVLHGPYRWIRHPLYDSAALCIMAISLIAANWFLFVAGIVGLGLLVTRTRTEEEHLVARFGDRYRAYIERTGRFLPKVRGHRRGA